MAKDYGNIVFYRTKNGKLRWFDPTKIPGGHPREKKVEKAIEHGKAFRSDEKRNLKTLKREGLSDSIKEANREAMFARKDYTDAQEDVARASRYGRGKYGRSVDEEKEAARDVGKQANQAANTQRRIMNLARREQPEVYGKNRRDEQNINRAKKKIEQNEAYAEKQQRRAIEAAKFNQQSAAPVQSAQKEVRRTQMTPEREERAARALAKKQFNKEAIAQTEAYDREDAAAKRTRNANYKLMNEEGNWDRTGGNNREDIIAARRELKKAGNAWRAASNDSERADLEAKRAANALNQNKITDRDQRNIERAQAKAEERAHIKKMKEKASNPNFDAERYAKYFDKDGKLDMSKFDEYQLKMHGRELNERSAEKQREAKEMLANKAAAKPRYVIKDRHGNLLSSPNEDAGELLDRIAYADPDGRGGFQVVAHVEEKSQEKAKPAAAEPEKKQQPIRYVIKDRHGNILSSPNEDAGELLDRIAYADPDGRGGFQVVAHVEEKSQEIDDLQPKTTRTRKQATSHYSEDQLNDPQFRKDALSEINRYIRNWDYMTAREKRNIIPEGGGIKALRARAKELKSFEEATKKSRKKVWKD